MATTAPPAAETRRKGALEGESTTTAPGAYLAPPPKLRRRPVLIAASAAAICLGALLSLWAYNSTANAHDVLAMRHTVERGQVIAREDLMSVRVSLDPALKPLAADQAEAVVGMRAALDMPAGGVVTAEQVTDEAIPARGESVVGIALTSAMLPADQLKVGDPVRVVTTPGQQDDVDTVEPEAIEAVVVAVSRDDITGNTVVNVQVPYDSAPRVAARAAAGRVALVLDSLER